jgi:hypothetical protein
MLCGLSYPACDIRHGLSIISRYSFQPGGFPRRSAGPARFPAPASRASSICRKTCEAKTPVGRNERCAGGTSLPSRWILMCAGVFEDVDHGVQVALGVEQWDAGRVGAVLVGQARAADDLQLVELERVDGQRSERLAPAIRLSGVSLRQSEQQMSGDEQSRVAPPCGWRPACRRSRGRAGIRAAPRRCTTRCRFPVRQRHLPGQFRKVVQDLLRQAIGPRTDGQSGDVRVGERGFVELLQASRSS